MKVFIHNHLWIPLGLLTILGSGCKSAQSTNDRYEAAWEKIVSSEEWESSLHQSEVLQLSAESNQNDNWLSSDPVVEKTKDPFNSRYDSWVNQAYFKIISEAEAADARIKSEWDRFIAENPEAATSSDENVRKIMALYKKKYKSHKIMLEGLKSWNSFDNYGSDDLVFFKEEYENIVQAMYRDGRPEKDIVGYLVYKLADLYHLDNGMIVE